MRRLSVAGCSALHLLLFLPADHTLGTNRGPDLLLPFFLYGCRGQSGSSQGDFFIFLRTVSARAHGPDDLAFNDNGPDSFPEKPESTHGRIPGMSSRIRYRPVFAQR